MADAAVASARLDLDVSAFDKKGALSIKKFAKSLEGAKDSADIAQAGIDALQHKFVKTLGGLAAIGAANVIASSMREVGKAASEAGEISQKALGQGGMASTFDGAITAANSFSSSAEKVQEKVNQINANPVSQLVGYLTGATEQSENLKKGLEDVATAQLKVGLAVAAKDAQARVGKSPEELAAMDREKAKAGEVTSLSNTPSFQNASGQDKAAMMASLKAKQNAEDEAKTVADHQKQQKEVDAMMRRATQMEQERARQNEKDDMEFRQNERDRQSEKADRDKKDAQELKDQEDAYQRDLFEADLQAIQDEKKMAQDAHDKQQKAQENARSQIPGILGASQSGQQAMGTADKRQAEAKRKDDFKFQEEALRATQEKMNADRKRQGLPGLDLQGVRNRLADQQAQANNPTLRDQAKAGGDGGGSKQIVEKLSEIFSKLLAAPMVGAQ